VNPEPSRRPQRRLRALLGVAGLVPIAAGVHTLLAGGRSIPPWRRANPMIESELRYYSAFYVAYGATALGAAAREEIDPATVKGLAAAMFLGGLGRVGAWLAAGRPHPLQRALLALELAVPPLLVSESARHTPGLGDAGLDPADDSRARPRSTG
jgi:hypothetical protein